MAGILQQPSLSPVLSLLPLSLSLQSCHCSCGAGAQGRVGAMGRRKPKERLLQPGLSGRVLWSPRTGKASPTYSQVTDDLGTMLFLPKSYVLKSVTHKHRYDSYSRD